MHFSPLKTCSDYQLSVFAVVGIPNFRRSSSSSLICLSMAQKLDNHLSRMAHK